MGDGNVVINYSANELANGCQKHILKTVDISGSVSILRFKVADKLGLQPDQLGNRTLILTLTFTWTLRGCVQ